MKFITATLENKEQQKTKKIHKDGELVFQKNW